MVVTGGGKNGCGAWNPVGADVTCFFCKREGHFKFDCPEKWAWEKLKKKGELDTAAAAVCCYSDSEDDVVFWRQVEEYRFVRFLGVRFLSFFDSSLFPLHVALAGVCWNIKRITFVKTTICSFSFIILYVHMMICISNYTTYLGSYL